MCSVLCALWGFRCDVEKGSSCMWVLYLIALDDNLLALGCFFYQGIVIWGRLLVFRFFGVSLRASWGYVFALGVYSNAFYGIL